MTNTIAPNSTTSLVTELADVLSDYMDEMENDDYFPEDCITCLDDTLSESNNRELSPLSQDYSSMKNGERVSIICQVFNETVNRNCTKEIKDYFN